MQRSVTTPQVKQRSTLTELKSWLRTISQPYIKTIQCPITSSQHKETFHCEQGHLTVMLNQQGDTE